MIVTVVLPICSTTSLTVSVIVCSVSSMGTSAGAVQFAVAASVASNVPPGSVDQA